MEASSDKLIVKQRLMEERRTRGWSFDAVGSWQEWQSTWKTPHQQSLKVLPWKSYGDRA